MLKVEAVRAGYGQTQVLHGTSLEINEGECVAVLGRNGAGKTTLMRTISGLQRASAGVIEFRGRPIHRVGPPKIARLGIGHVQEGRRIFRRQSVLDNLRLGAYAAGRSGADGETQLDHVFQLFPVLKKKSTHAAGLLSGGEQQMLAIGQALMASPSLLLLDEPSSGLAPPLAAQLFESLASLTAAGTAILVAEQYVKKALSISARAYVLDRGVIVLSGTANSVLADDRLTSIYMEGGEQKSRTSKTGKSHGI